MLSSDLREILQQYVEGAIPLEALEDWLAPRLPSLCQFPDSPDSDAVAAVELGLAQMSDGLVTEEEFRRSIAALLRQHGTVQIAWDPDLHPDTGSASQRLHLEMSVMEHAPVTQPYR